MIIFTTIVSYAVIVIDPNDIYNKVIVDKTFMPKLYETGQVLETPLSKEDVHNIILKYITFILENAKKGFDDGSIKRLRILENGLSNEVSCIINLYNSCLILKSNLIESLECFHCHKQTN